MLCFKDSFTIETISLLASECECGVCTSKAGHQHDAWGPDGLELPPDFTTRLKCKTCSLSFTIKTFFDQLYWIMARMTEGLMDGQIDR